jgi:hypothetical protein
MHFVNSTIQMYNTSLWTGLIMFLMLVIVPFDRNICFVSGCFLNMFCLRLYHFLWRFLFLLHSNAFVWFFLQCNKKWLVVFATLFSMRYIPKIYLKFISLYTFILQSFKCNNVCINYLNDWCNSDIICFPEISFENSTRYLWTRGWGSVARRTKAG